MTIVTIHSLFTHYSLTQSESFIHSFKVLKQYSCKKWKTRKVRNFNAIYSDTHSASSDTYIVHNKKKQQRKVI